MAVTPCEAVVSGTEVARLRVSSASDVISQVGKVRVQPYHTQTTEWRTKNCRRSRFKTYFLSGYWSMRVRNCMAERKEV